MKIKPFKYPAYHEAGHAIIADYFDALIDVRLRPSPITSFHDCGVEINCYIQYGGVLAQARYQRRNIMLAMLVGGESDLEFIFAKSNERAAESEQEDGSAIRTRWMKLARSILWSRWRAVEAVAAKLLRQDLDALAVRRIVLKTKPGEPKLRF